MPINPNIPLSVNQYQKDPLGDYGKIMTLKNMMQQQELAPLQAQREAELFDMKKQEFGLTKDRLAIDQNQDKRAAEQAEMQKELHYANQINKALETATPETWPMMYEQFASNPDIGIEGMQQLGLSQQWNPEHPAIMKRTLDQFNQVVTMNQSGQPEWNPALRNVEEEKLKLKAQYGDTDQPSNVEEWKYYNKLNPEERNEYLRVKRADKILDIGSGFVATSPTDPTVTSPVIDKGLAPEKTAEHAADVMTAQENAKAGVEKEVSYPKIKAQMSALENQWDTVETTLDKAIKEVNPYTAGFGDWVSWIPATPQKNLSETLKTIQSNIGFDKLQSMRENSPTGGALGQVSDFENKLLQAVQGSLAQGQSAKQLKDNLQKVKDLLMKVREEKRAAFQNDYGDMQQDEGWQDL